LARVNKPEEQCQPRQVFPVQWVARSIQRIEPGHHFQNDKVDIATEKITEVLAALGASEDDLALTSRRCRRRYFVR